MTKNGYGNTDNTVPDSFIGASSRLNQEEREIVLVMNDKDRIWEASCSSTTYMRKFENQGWECYKTEYYRDGEVCTKFYRAPQKSITIGKRERPKRTLSPEQIEKMKKGKTKNVSQI